MAAMDARFLRPIVNYLALWLIVPEYDFEKREISGNNVKTVVRSVTIGLSIIAPLAFSIYAVIAIETSIGPYLKVVEVVIFVLGSLAVVTHVADMMARRNESRKFVRLMSLLDETLGPIEPGFYAACVRRFICCNVAFFAAVSYVCYQYVVRIGAVDYIKHPPELILGYRNFLLTFVLVHAVQNMRLKCRAISDALKTIKYDGEGASVSKIKTCESAYLLLSSAQASFNEFFGRQLLIMTLYVGGTALFLCLRVYVDPSRLPTLAPVLSLGILMTMQFAVMLSCDLVMKESEKVLVLCVELQEKFPEDSAEYHELRNLCDKLTLRKIKFTAAHCFDVDRSTIFSLVSNTVTYFIAIIQFIEKDSKHGGKN
ncbi:uncharacterized protein LOC132698560 [Cylas formicarius]|uniref:uncharacterized protein LOC132698560 n=1 Tax=Cylas formicarius TaxID=197179 RepID=UPI002958A5DF|nr:uncharacterized protein LOC132698560 [Cylas formicarius]